MTATAAALTSTVSLPPALKWAGGKRWQLPHLAPLWAPHEHRRLVEPFCGGLAVTLGLAPERALLNDVNPHLISFYDWLGRGLKIKLPLENNEALFYEYRLRFNALLKAGKGRTAEAASLFYFLNRTGYNGLCRFNQSGEFNVPFGSYKTINYTRDFSAYKAFHGKGNQYVSSAQLCFAVQALRAWADAAPLGAPFQAKGDGERIVTYWRGPPPPPPYPDAAPLNDYFTICADVPSRPKTLWVEVDRSMRAVRFGLMHR